MNTTPARSLALAAVLAVAGVLTIGATAAADAPARPPVEQPAAEFDPVEFGEQLTAARVGHRWPEFVALAYPSVTGERAAALARSLAVDEPGPGDPEVDVLTVAVFVEAPRYRLWVRAIGAEVHTWEWVLDRDAVGRWHVVEHDRDPGGETLPAG